MSEHYTEGRRWSHISKAWILADAWNDTEEIARLSAELSAAERQLDNFRKNYVTRLSYGAVCADIADVREQLTKAEAAILWVLWGHQGGSSPVGQPLRKFLNIGECDELTAEQVAAAKGFDY